MVMCVCLGGGGGGKGMVIWGIQCKKGEEISVPQSVVLWWIAGVGASLTPNKLPPQITKNQLH